MARRIFVLRHGETQFNSGSKLQGHCNSSLTEKGVMQARNYGLMLRELLSAGEIEIYSSPLGRAVQTANLVCNVLELSTESIIEDARLKEFNLGDWEERTIPSLIKEYPNLLEENDWYLRAPNAESYEAVRSRLESWLSSIPNTKDIVIISHGLTGIVLRGLLLDLEYEAVWEQDLPQDAFFIIENNKIQRINCAIKTLAA